MSKGAESQRLTPEERANLVAYIDGELNEAEARSIATKLTQSVSARREVEVLQKTWELLDQLPMPRASEALSQRTMVEVENIDLAGDKLLKSASQTAMHLVKLVIWLVASTVLFTAGFFLVQYLIPDPTRRLARDLPIAEHLKEYREVGSLEFLKKLDESPEFGNDPN